MADNNETGRFCVYKSGDLVRLWVCEHWPWDRNANLFLDQDRLKALIKELQAHVMPDD